MKTRAQHLAWCKERALAFVDAGEFEQALASFASDVTKHEETLRIRDHVTTLGYPQLIGGQLNSKERMRDHINGYR